MITLRFACRHRITFTDTDQPSAPVCPTCGERRVSHVTAPAPRFSGMAGGPCATGHPVSSRPMTLVAKEP